MLSAVTSSVVEEMLSVRPRTAAGAVWALGMMQFQAPAFMEAAYDRYGRGGHFTGYAPGGGGVLHAWLVGGGGGGSL